MMRILVAENGAPLGEFLWQQLQEEPFPVRVLTDGLEAQRLASEQPFNMVLLDLGLPEPMA
jgi:DNA-binding response OmpR family regulator